MRKTTFLSHFYVKTIILPRQARDKHRNHSTKKALCAGPNDYVNADISDGVWVQDEPFLAGKSIKFNMCISSHVQRGFLSTFDLE